MSESEIMPDALSANESEKKSEAIMAGLSRGERQCDLAKEHGVSRQRIHQIASNVRGYRSLVRQRDSALRDYAAAQRDRDAAQQDARAWQAARDFLAERGLLNDFILWEARRDGISPFAQEKLERALIGALKS